MNTNFIMFLDDELKNMLDGKTVTIDIGGKNWTCLSQKTYDELASQKNTKNESKRLDDVVLDYFKQVVKYKFKSKKVITENEISNLIGRSGLDLLVDNYILKKITLPDLDDVSFYRLSEGHGL